MRNQSFSHESWISVQEMQDNLRPHFYAPIFREIAARLKSHPNDYVKLEKYIKPVLPKAMDADRIAGDNIKWIIRSTENLIEAVRADSLNLPHLSMIVPDNSIVVRGILGNSFQPSLYWDQSIFRGKAVTSINNLIFTANGSNPIAWIQKALTDEIVVKQLYRGASGVILTRIWPASLLQVHVPLRSTTELQHLSNQVIISLKHRLTINDKHVRVGGTEFDQTIMISGATFEQKLDHFEKLLKDRLAGDQPVFFIEASTNNPDSDLFIVRSLFGKGGQKESVAAFLKPSPDQDPDVSLNWRRWYWSGNLDETIAVYNSFEGHKELPDNLLSRMVFNPWQENAEKHSPVHLLSFQTVKNIIEANRDETVDLEQMKVELLTAWQAVNGPSMPSLNIREWIDQIYRPLLAIKVIKSNETAGVYLIFGQSQILDFLTPIAELRYLGEELSSILNRAIIAGDEIIRNESLRRLSWIMHQISSPIMILRNGLEDFSDFLNKNPEFAAKLLPDEASANRRAEMQHINVTEYSFYSRLEAVKSALQDLNRLKYQVRRFKNAHRDLNLKDVLIPGLLDKLARTARESLPDLQVDQAMHPGLVCSMDEEIIYTALEEVILNACREFKARNTNKPVLSLAANFSHQNLIIRISDNALPVDCSLSPDVFEEDASTYARSNQGTGLGLAIVRASFVQHGGRCSLEINYAADGSRQPGVTFAGELPFQPRRST